MNLFIISYNFSIFVQVISLIIQCYGYLISNITPELVPLKYALNIEFFVSIVELIVYIWIGYSLSNYDIVMSKRYVDWFITTNFLMISISLLFIYYNQREERNKKHDEKEVAYVENDRKKLIDLNIPKYAPLLVYNNLMLLFGYLGEINVLSTTISTSVGFVFFFLGFYHFYHTFAKYSQSGKLVFYCLFAIWAMYGIAHTFKNQAKNISYNILDLISKNMFGVFMVYMLLNPEALKI